MVVGKRDFIVIYNNGDKKVVQGDDLSTIYVRALALLLAMHKEAQVSIIIDDANAKIYSDFEWDFAFSEKDKVYVTGNPKMYTESQVEVLLMSYVKYVGADEIFAAEYFNRQTKTK